jgi:hypothetical protein
VIYGWFHDYSMLGGRMMTDQEERSLKEARRKEKLATGESEQLARDQARRKANLVREQTIEEDQQKRKTEREEKRAAAEIKQLTRDQARRKANLAREQAIEENQKERKLKAKKNM